MFSELKMMLIVFLSTDGVSYLVSGLFPSRGNRTSSLGSSPADGGKLLLLRPDAPASTVTLL